MYKCESCNIEYSSRMGFYKHNKKHHPEKINKGPNLTCAFCKREFKHYPNKWTHEQKCKLRDVCIQNKEKTDEFNLMKTEIELLKKKIETLESKPVTNITNNTINNSINTSINNSINNSIKNSIKNLTMVFPFGQEPSNCLSESKVIKTIEEHGINAITVLCKIKHFNPENPELHNFCVTSKNDPYAIIVDPETKRTKSVNKKEVFDRAYYGLVMNIDSIKTPKPEIEETKDKIKALSMSKPMLKQIRLAFNQEAYHNKDMVQKTWEKATFNVEDVKTNQKPIKTRQQLIEELAELITDINNGFEIEV